MVELLLLTVCQFRELPVGVPTPVGAVGVLKPQLDSKCHSMLCMEIPKSERQHARPPRHCVRSSPRREQIGSQCDTSRIRGTWLQDGDDTKYWIVRRVDDLQLELPVIANVYEERDLRSLLPASLSLLLLELLPLELQRLLLSTEDVQSYCECYRRDNKRHQRDYGNHPGRLSGHLIPVRHPKEATDRPAMKVGRLPLAIGLAAPLAVANPAPATGPTAGRGSSTAGAVLLPSPGQHDGTGVS